MQAFRSGQARVILLYLLAPIIMITGMVLVNSVSKENMKAFATFQGAAVDAKLCVIEDFQKLALVIMGAVAGTIIGLLFRMEADAEFAKRNYMRRIGYMTVALLTSSCGTPYLLMKISEDQPKPLCLLMGMGVSFFAWLILEAFYGRAKALISWLMSYLPLPKVPDEQKDKKPPAD